MSQKVINGHVIDVLAAMEPESAHMAITSPPYWGLRNYQTEPQVWPCTCGGCDGGLDCEHEWGEWHESHDEREETKHGKTRTTDRHYGDESRRFDGNHQKHTAGAFCQKCRAWRGSLGLEPAPELFVDHIVQVLREVRRVLRPDGTLWLNMGDCYTGGGCGADKMKGPGRLGAMTTERHETLKPKDLCMMPARVAMALQADGWYLRKDIIWAKGISFCDAYSGSVMPESVNGWRWERHRIKTASHHRGTETQRKGANPEHPQQDHDGNSGFQASAEWEDCPGCEKCADNDGLILRRGAWRPTSGHEHLFLLTKSENYYCDAEAVREQGSIAAGVRAAKGSNVRSELKDVNGRPPEYWDYTGQRNLRDVWTINPQPYPEAHFATFPEKLVEPCIKAGTSPHACGQCGAPWARVVETTRTFESGSGRSGNMPAGKNGPDMQGGGATLDVRRGPCVKNQTLGWRPTCDCAGKADVAGGDAPLSSLPDGQTSASAVVLDPFAGSGTVGLVCKRLGRDFMGVELNGEYCKLARKRISQPVTKEMFQ